MQSQAEQATAQAAGEADDGASLVTEVDFKWLMAGQGWWIDTTRFHSDPSYAARFLRLALASSSFALRQCAALLQARMGGALACGARRSAG